ncbi:DUF420 domain-containing protein [bacterium]|nr:DUF420 domain-containing protein [bacterium]
MKIQDKGLWIISAVVSGAAFVFLVWLIYIKQTPVVHSKSVDQLPLVNSVLNACSAIALAVGFKAIRAKNRSLHQLAMMTAFIFSTLFLITYVIYHSVHGDTHFLGVGVIRWIYFGVLGSHVMCTIIGLPLILTTFGMAVLKRFESHKKVARWTFPIWMYISITGVLVFIIPRLPLISR